jgi:hypothetical protein
MKTTFLVTADLIASSLHLPADVKIFDIETSYKTGNFIKITVEGENLPDKEICEPTITKIELNGDTTYKWNWEKQ